MNRARSQHGLSLVEATIILMSLMVLGGVLAPSIKDYIDDAKMVKVKEDCEAIGSSIARLLRDVGSCVKMDGRLPCTIYNRADLLVSEGHEVEGYAGAAQSAFNASSEGYTTASYETAGTTETVNYVTEYVPRPVPAGTAWKDATHLGGSTAFYSALITTASLKRMIDAQGLAADIRTVLRDSGIPEAADGVIDTLRALSEVTTPAGSLESCSRVEPQPGSVVECQIEVGDTLHWMAYRPGARSGNRTPSRLQHVRWAGKESVRSFAFRVDTNTESFIFVIPAPCANLSLMSVADITHREVRVAGVAATTRTATTSHSYSATRASYSAAAWGSVSANARSAIGWFNTPMWAGLPNGHPNVDFLENQLIRNWPSGSPSNHYSVPGQVSELLVGPRFNLGWRGAYLSSPIGDDPWGHKYFVNTIFLYAFGNVPHAEGYVSWSSDTFCLSAGPNGWIETPFASSGYEGTGSYGTTYQSGYSHGSAYAGTYGYGSGGYGDGPQHPGGTYRGGDDFVYVIAGGSR